MPLLVRIFELFFCNEILYAVTVQGRGTLDKCCERHAGGQSGIFMHS